MKKTFIFILFLASFAGFSQGITVDPSYTATQLINDVLINSPCITGTNVQSSTGSNFGSTNGIGYFTNANPNFPFAKGIVLMTGDVTKVPSPNNTVLSGGSNAWPGDADLEANLLAQSGVTINSINASYIEFDFTPRTTNLGFDFVFASEEYGSSQCNFSDAFAFLIKDITNPSANVNIALVPAPAAANTPISVETIRNSLYNASCPSVNPAYFGAFNGPGFGPAINFNGQTVKMTALANGLNTTHVYRIKLVIADGGANTGYDSAIFLNANSFNSTPNTLGPDIALCATDPLPTLQATSTFQSGTTYRWLKDNVVIPGQTTSQLNLATLPATYAPVAGDNVYTLGYTEPSCSELTDDITVKLYAPINAMAAVPNIYTCNTSASNYDFDLTKNTTIITNNNTPTNPADDLTGVEITYHLTNTDAVNDAPGLTSPHNILSSQSGQTIYARIENAEHTCYVIRSFQLLVVAPPTIVATPAPISLCPRNATDNPSRAVFDITPAVSAAMGSQSTTYNVVSFYGSQPNAIAGGATGLTVIPNYASYITPTRTLWIRITNISNPGCYAITSVQLTVKPLPDLGPSIPDVVVCTAYDLPALTAVGAGYYFGPNGTNPVTNTHITQTKTVYVYNMNATTGCSAQKTFKITIADLPAITPVSGKQCTSYTLPALPYGKYYGQPGGVGPEITQVTTPGPNTLYVRFEDTVGTPTCVQEQSFVITIVPFTPLPTYENKFGCSSYTLPSPEPNGGNYFSDAAHTIPITNLTLTAPNTTVYVYKSTGGTPPDCEDLESFDVFVGPAQITVPADVNSCTAYNLPPLTVGEYRNGPNGGNGVAMTVVPSTMDVYIYVPGQTCTNNIFFHVTIAIDLIPPIADVPSVCDIYYFPQLNHTGAYYSGPNGTGTKYANDGTTFTTLPGTHTYYFYDKLPNGSCFAEEPFDVTIYPSPAIDARPVDVSVCNSCFTLDTLTNGQYYTNQGGPANNPSGPLAPGTQICGAGLHTVWVYAGSVSPNTCFQEYKRDITIVTTTVNLISNKVACDTDNFTLPAIVGPGDYYTLSGGPTTPGNVKITPPYTAMTTPGVYTFYVYAEDNNRIPCSDEDDFTVTIYQKPIVSAITPPAPACDTYILPAYSTFTSTPANAVNHYFTNSGGPGGGNVELFPNDPITSNTTIYVVAQESSLTCFDEKPLAITVNHKPNLVASEITSLSRCDTYTLPTLSVGDYYDSTYTTILAPYTINTPGANTVYVRAFTGTAPNICPRDASFVVTINQTPTVNPIPAIPACTSYTLPAYNDPMFTTTTGVAVSHFYTLPGGPSASGQSEKFPTNVINSSTTLYAYAEVGTAPNLCFDDEPFAINISTVPTLTASEIDDEYACDTYTLPALTTGIYTESDYTTPRIGGNIITTIGTNPIYVHAENSANPACKVDATFNVYITKQPVITPSDIATQNACNSYTLPVLATPNAQYYTGANAAGPVIAAGTTYTSNTTVYVHAVNGTAPHTCEADGTLVINVYNVDELPDVPVCGTFTFPALTAAGATYYNGTGGTGTHYVPGDTYSAIGAKTFYVYGSNGSCTDESDFVVTINPSATYTAPSAQQLMICDNVDGTPNDHVGPFNLDSLTPTILGSQNPADYAVSYYPSMVDAQFSTNVITTDGTPLEDTSLNTVYVKVYNISNPTCSVINPITINVISLPLVNDPISGYICTDSSTGQVFPAPLAAPAEYSPIYYSFQWKDDTGVVVSNTNTFDALIPGNYTLEITANGLTGCDSGVIPVTVGASATADNITYQSVGWFTDHQTLTITAGPNPADFLYSLDGATPQASNVFTDVKSGMHELTVINIHGCGIAPLPIQIPLVNNPQFFTPNGDGINDVWRIAGLEPGAEIFIYDRYGKLIKQLTQSADSWDGTFNGNLLPASDYWFTVTYTENGVPKEFKSHFSLVR